MSEREALDLADTVVRSWESGLRDFVRLGPERRGSMLLLVAAALQEAYRAGGEATARAITSGIGQ